MEYQNLLIQLNAETGVQTITINREKKLNALNMATMAELDAAFDAVKDDSTVKAVVVTGAGPKAFVAGADISEFSSLGAEAGQAFATKGQSTFAKIEVVPQTGDRGRQWLCARRRMRTGYGLPHEGRC